MDKPYSEFPIKIYEIVLTTFFITSFFTIFTTMKESGYDVVIVPIKIINVLIPAFYLIWGYKITIENKKTLSNEWARYMIYCISGTAIFLSLAHMQEIAPIFVERNLGYLDFVSHYYNDCFYHPLLSVSFFIFFVIFYWHASNGSENRWNICHILLFLELSSIGLLPEIGLIPAYKSICHFSENVCFMLFLLITGIILVCMTAFLVKITYFIFEKIFSSAQSK